MMNPARPHRYPRRRRSPLRRRGPPRRRKLASCRAARGGPMSRCVDLFVDSDLPIDEVADQLRRLAGVALTPSPDAATYVLRDGPVVVELGEHAYGDDGDLRLSRAVRPNPQRLPARGHRRGDAASPHRARGAPARRVPRAVRDGPPVPRSGGSERRGRSPWRLRRFVSRPATRASRGTGRTQRCGVGSRGPTLLQDASADTIDGEVLSTRPPDD
jgi:hypothetical protein